MESTFKNAKMLDAIHYGVGLYWFARFWGFTWTEGSWHCGGAENAGVENAEVEKAGAITYGKPSEQKTLKTRSVG